jgi:PAS domain S-box-containing protein
VAKSGKGKGTDARRSSPSRRTTSRATGPRPAGARTEAVARRKRSTRDGAVRALHESEARFHELADNISQFAWTADRTGRRYWYNKRWLDYTGTTIKEMEGWGWQKVHHPEHVDRVVEKIRRSFEDGMTWEDTFPLRGRNGDYRWFLSRALPIRDGAGEIVRWFGTNTDVTEQIEAERALRRLNQTLEQRVEAATSERLQAEEKLQEARRALAQAARRTSLAALSAGIAHEIKNPLGAILTNAEAGLMSLAAGPSALNDVRDCLTDIAADVQRAHKVIESVRAVFGEASGPGKSVGVNDIVRQIVTLLRSELKAAGAQIEFDLAPDLPLILGRAGQLQQVFLNLVINAAEAMMKIEDRQRLLRIESKRLDPNGIELTFQDSGPGIDAENIARIFDTFFTTKRDGMGMGLSICRSIVEAHGGTLSVASAMPNGSIFRVALPNDPST